MLFEQGEGNRALVHLDTARTTAPDDAELKAMTREIHAMNGDAALAAWLLTELNSKPVAEDARALLTLDETSVEQRALGARVLGEQSPVEVAVLILGGGRAPDVEVEDARRWVAAFPRLLPVVVARSRALSDSQTLALADALVACGIDGVAGAFAAELVARRARSFGVAAALVDAQRWHDEAKSKESASAVLRLAARVGDRDLVRELAVGNGLVAVEGLLNLEGSSLLESASQVGRRALLKTAHTDQAHGEATLALLRHGDHAGAVRALAVEDRALARRLHSMRPTSTRLDARVQLARFLDDEDRASAQQQTATLAFDVGQFAVARGAAADAIDHGQDTEAIWRLRADAAVRAEDDDAGVWCGVAADRLENPDESVDYRRRAIQLLLRAGETGRVLDENLVALANSPPADLERLQEALGIARATQKHPLVDQLLAEKVRRTADDDREAAIEERATHQLKVLRDPAAAVSTFESARDLDPHFVDRAYRLGVKSGLVVELIAVAEDALAQAALLGALGREAEAEAALTADPEVQQSDGAHWLRADLAALAGDRQREHDALAKLPKTHPDVVDRLAGVHLILDDADAALSLFADALVNFGNSETRVDGMVASMPTANEDAVKRALDSLKVTFGEGSSTFEPPPELLEVWVAAAERLGDDDAAYTGRLQIARQSDSDASWGAWYRTRVGAISRDP